jgi:hypothetical protein
LPDAIALINAHKKGSDRAKNDCDPSDLHAAYLQEGVHVVKRDLIHLSAIEQLKISVRHEVSRAE